MKSKICALLATILITVIIGAAALLPPPDLPQIPGRDKVHHAVAFAVLALPIAGLVPRWLPAAGLMFAAYGGLIEVIQPYFGRDAQLSDWWADLAGIVVGTILGLLLNQTAIARRLRKRR